MRSLLFRMGILRHLFRALGHLWLLVSLVIVVVLLHEYLLIRK
jgi:hypothetical protein